MGPIIARDEKGPSERPTCGTVQAVCAFVEDIGTHEGSYQGRPTRRHQIVLCWELAEKMTLGENVGKPFMVSKFYTLSLNEKANLSQDLENWFAKKFTDQQRKEGFDMSKLIGHNCYLNLIESETGHIRVGSIMPLPRELPKLIVTNTKPPKWIDDQRAKSIEAQAMNGHGDFDVPPVPVEDDLPF